MEFQRRDMEWPVYGTSTETCGADLMTDIEDGGVDQMSIMHPASEAIAILDENVGTSVGCYDASNCGVGINFGSDTWMNTATPRKDYHPGADMANFNAQQTKILGDASSMEYDTPNRFTAIRSYDASASLIDSSPARNSHPLDAVVGADRNTKENEKYASSSSSSSSSSQGKGREECNWKNISEVSNLNVTTTDSDMGTGYGDGDVEDAYHAIFGEEKKCTKGQKSSNVSSEPSPTSGGSCNVDIVLDAAAAALSGAKRDRKGRLLEGKKEEAGFPILSKTVKNDISSYAVGKVVTITSGEYCDWEGEILCIETSQSYPKSPSKNKQSEAFYVVSLQYSDGSPLDCCALVSHSMISSARSHATTDAPLDDISDDTYMGSSASSNALNIDTSECITADPCPSISAPQALLDSSPKASKLSFQISPIRPGRNDKPNDKASLEKSDIAGDGKHFSEECIDIVEAFTADLVQRQIDSEIVLSVLNGMKSNIEIDSKDQKKKDIRDFNINNKADKKGVTDKDGGETIPSNHEIVKSNLDVSEKCQFNKKNNFRADEGKETFSQCGIVRAEEKVKHERILIVDDYGDISKIESKATHPESDIKNESEIKCFISSAVVSVEEKESGTNMGISEEKKIIHKDEGCNSSSSSSNNNSSSSSSSGVTELSEKSVSSDSEKSTSDSSSDSEASNVSAGVNDTKDANIDIDAISNDKSSNSNNNSVDENESDVQSEPLSSAQVRCQQYAALRAFDMSTVGRRVRITATNNKHRTRYGTVVSVVDLTHYLISVTFVSPFQHKSPKSKSGDSNSLGPSSCCVCLYLSVEDFIFVD